MHDFAVFELAPSYVDPVRPTRWQTTLKASVNEAALAVRIYNDSAEIRAFEGFVVHMHLAWLYLMHARFIRDDVEFRYPHPTFKGRFQIIDGEHKRWELARCVKERWTDVNAATRKNLEFFIALRNKIEHRHAETDRNLLVAVSGHSHALLLNFEDELTSTFGSDLSLAEVLRFPIFVGTFTTAGEETLVALREKLPADLKRFIAEYHAGLEADVEDDSRFELRLRVVLQHASRDDAAMSMQFTRWNDMTDDEKARFEALGKTGHTVVREQSRSVVGHGLLRPAEVATQVEAQIPFKFNVAHATGAWKIAKIRPPTDAPKPERTDDKYCLYIEVSKAYGYTPAWVKRLSTKCATVEGFKSTTGFHPVTRQTAASAQD